MQKKIATFNQFLNTPLNFNSRILVIIAALILIPSIFTPMWHMGFGSLQYPEGLNLYIYPSKLVGGDDGNDLTEINVLNHYIGMSELRNEDFTEFNWIPLIIVLLSILAFRAAILGTSKSLIDILSFMICFGGFSIWRFRIMLLTYGHNLDPKAAIKIEPFTPPMFGKNLVGQFTVDSYPAIGILFFTLFMLLLVVGIFLTYRQKKKTV
jgi:copper chaperone NosL